MKKVQRELLEDAIHFLGEARKCLQQIDGLPAEQQARVDWVSDKIGAALVPKLESVKKVPS